jgi:hypothetical protein
VVAAVVVQLILGGVLPDLDPTEEELSAAARTANDLRWTMSGGAL